MVPPHPGNAAKINELKAIIRKQDDEIRALRAESANLSVIARRLALHGHNLLSRGSGFNRRLSDLENGLMLN